MFLALFHLVVYPLKLLKIKQKSSNMNKSSNQVMWFPEGTFKEREPSKQNHTHSDESKLEILAKFTIGIFSPFLAVAAIRDKNIKARIPGVDPLQKNYLKK